MDEKTIEQAFDAWWATQFFSDDERDAQLVAWLACYQHLAPQLKDAYDLGWLRCVEWSGRDDLAADMQSTAYLNERTNTLKALADKAAREQEKKTC